MNDRSLLNISLHRNAVITSLEVRLWRETMPFCSAGSPWMPLYYGGRQRNLLVHIGLCYSQDCMDNTSDIDQLMVLLLS